MLSSWPIRRKLLFGVSLLLVLVGALAWSGFQGVYAYRGLVRGLRDRGAELPLAAQLNERISALRVLSKELSAPRATATDGANERRRLGQEFAENFGAARESLQHYRDQLAQAELDDDVDRGINDSHEEREKVSEIEAAVARLTTATADPEWFAADEGLVAVDRELVVLARQAQELPSYFHARLRKLIDEVRGTYRALIILNWLTTISAAVILTLLLKLFYGWVFQPLQTLIEGSRRVAAGEFSHRIELVRRDEMMEMAEAMNDMTARFRAIRDDLDRQVQQRTQQVVRSEQLASVGFLAAGVAHEINNPLASIAMCAESLEGRVAEIFASRGDEGRAEQDVVRQYLRMIQTEAFRCKGITERLLDFSRLGDLQRHDTELGELVQGVIDMVGHLGTYHDKRIEFAERERVVAPVNAQELKQVVLNLITNALDSLSSGGTVRISLRQSSDRAELIFEDDGCGMTDEVLEHLFEPFFTRRRAGQGTGLGLSISYRIIVDHGGQIDVHSEGPGQGSRFRVSLPLAEPHKENVHRHQAA